MDYFVHEKAICETTRVGKDTRIWAFAHLLPDAVIGEGCNICDGVFIENDVVIADRVTIKCGVQLWDGLRIMDDVFIGPNVTFSNDKFPRSRQIPDQFLHTIVEKGASIGANATILPGLRIGMGAMVGAGAVVTKDVPPKAVVVGNPAKIVSYAGLGKRSDVSSSNEMADSYPVKLGVGDAELWQLNSYEDMRGSLVVSEFESDLPFIPQRSFIVYNVPSEDVRGEHAHKICEQFLVCLHGTVHVVVDDGDSNREVCLNAPNMGVYMPTMIWGVQYKFSQDAVLMVYASHAYDSDEYIRDYDEFISERSKTSLCIQ